MPPRIAVVERLLQADYFEFFDLPHKLDIDLADLQERYYQLSRKWHPDLFACKSASEQQEAEESTATLNDAYRTLKDPIRRVEYVLAGKGLAAAHQSTPPDLLEEVFELNMALEEMRDGDDSVKPQLLDAQRRFAEMLEKSDARLRGEFSKYDESAESLGRMRAILNRRNYIRNLVRDVDSELNK